MDTLLQDELCKMKNRLGKKYIKNSFSLKKVILPNDFPNN
jgi:hypothetical protein